MATIERQPGYHYTERAYYNNNNLYPLEKEVIVETKKPRIGKCTCVLAAIFLIFIIILVICLIIFFTWGAAYITGPAATGATASPEFRNGELFLEQSSGGQAKALHFDLDLPRYVMSALKNRQPKICLLDTAYLAQNYYGLYTKEHIPGARHFNISQVFKAADDGSVQLAHPLDFQAYARSLGIDGDCQVITYDHGDQSDSIITSTFVWWLFKLYGHSRVTVMNGGLKEWKKFTANDAAFQVVSGSPTPVQQGDLRASWNPKWIITYPDVLSKIEDKKTQVVDSRTTSEFSGAVKPGDAKEGGRIKYAISAPTSEILNADGGFKSLQEIKDWLKSKKIDGTQPVVVYDNTAIEASALYFAMIQAGYESRLYDDGWKEWAERAPTQYKERG